MGPVFDSRDKRYKDPFGAAACSADIRFALEDETYYGCELLVYREFAGKEDVCALPPAEGGFAGTYTAPAEADLCWYAFRLTDGDGHLVWFGKNGVQDAPEKLIRWQLTVYEDTATPEWFGEGVTYQIFPDRFRRVAMPDVSRMVGRRWLHESWSDRPVFLPEVNGEITNRDFFGGSLAGITEKLDYLRGLGVTTLYLNPIFEAASNHRYDTADYRAIDPLLGSKEDFRALCDGAHERGMRARRRAKAPPITTGTASTRGRRSTTRGGACGRCPPSTRSSRTTGTSSSAARTAWCGTGCAAARTAGGWTWRTSCPATLSRASAAP